VTIAAFELCSGTPPVLVLGDAVGWILVLGDRAGLALTRRERTEIVLVRRRVELCRAVVVVGQRLVHLRVGSAFVGVWVWVCGCVGVWVSE